jgi:uncharacterized protein YabE (DUF348 family)
MRIIGISENIKKNLKTTLAVGFLLVACLFVCACASKRDLVDFSSGPRNITVEDDGLSFEISTQASTMGEALDSQKISTQENDIIFPSKDTKIFTGSKIIIERAKNITITSDGKTEKGYVYGRTVAEALWENKINMGEDDFTTPNLNYPIQDNDKIEVVRVDIREEVVKKDIPFKTIENEDDKLSWRTKKVTQKGENGINEITYKVVSHNGKEISRKIIYQNQTKDPVTEIVTQGTYMKLGKSKTGQGTWYAFRGGLFAASTTLPRGSYAKVTNTENGKSVVVQINDYGPQGKGRIIDLDKVAFQKIANIGAGVIGVKVEQVLN